MPVKSVYNFVPAPKESEVFCPDWANHVNHDLPFSDGESGEIDITITAETPIFIRNGHSKEEEMNEFAHYVINGEKKYFIPATSLKGMFRNVLEIMTNSKLSQLNNHRHAIRQIMKTKDTVIDEGYELSQDEVKRQIQCGYLIKRGEKYFIHSCGAPLKIRYTDIDGKFKKGFEKQFGVSDEANIKENFGNRTAAYKYKLLEGKELEGRFEIHPLDEDEKQKSWMSKFQPLRYARYCNESEENSFDGRIVLVGQASNYNISTARRGEYVFRGKKSEVLGNDKNSIEVPIDKIDDFKFVNRDEKGESQELKDWAFWKKHIIEGIPVFFRVKEIKGNIEIIDFGLSFMYKQPARYKVKDFLLKYSEKMDLAETIFGSINKGQESKGRVFIGHACCIEEAPKVLDKVVVTLGSPKSSFTPFYLKQDGGNGKTKSFNTYNSYNVELKGFKRYPMKKKILPHLGESEKLQSHFIPLNAGNKFKAIVRFHNLRPLELGALLSTITLGNTDATFHNLGYAKPLGYGFIKINNIKLSGVKKELLHYTKIFIVEMLARFGESWKNRINELLSMSIVPDTNMQFQLEYNDLKDFQEIKNNGEYLQDYTAYGTNYNYKPNFNEDASSRILEIKKEQEYRLERIKLLKEELEELKSQNKFEDAIQKIMELNSIERVENLNNEILGIQNLQKNYLDEKNRIIQEQNQREQKVQNARAGLPPEWQSVDSFQNISKRIEKWVKLQENQIVSDHLKTELSIVLEAIIQIELNNKKKKNWEGDFDKNNNWKRIIEWLGHSLAKELFNKLMNV